MEFRRLRADEIDCRISQVSKKGVMCLLYKDARCDMNILDETLGAENWQRKHDLINGNLFCSVGIYVKDRNEWIWKQDVGTESYTEKEKGQASDSFKRACVNLGIGRELYTAPFIWFNASDCNIIEDKKCYDSFRVTDIGYDGRNIVRLTVVNDKTHKKFTFNNTTERPAKEKESKPVQEQAVDYAELKAKVLGYINRHLTPEQIEKTAKSFKVASLSELNEEQCQYYVEFVTKNGGDINN